MDGFEKHWNTHNHKLPSYQLEFLEVFKPVAQAAWQEATKQRPCVCDAVAGERERKQIIKILDEESFRAISVGAFIARVKDRIEAGGGMVSKIEWCDVTWNPITGCTPISEGCQNCYAKRMANRLQGRFGYPDAPNQFDVTFHPDRLTQVARWKKSRKIFVCSMGDLFHSNVPFHALRKIFFYIYGQRQHKYLILTKRPGNMKIRFEQLGKFQYNPYDFNHVWLGVTAENQKRADERIPILLQIPAAVRFVSVEPMLGPVDLLGQEHIGRIHSKHEVERLDWVIAGPETGPGARECKPEWIEDLYEQCKAAGVSFFDKRKDYLAREFPK